MIYKWLKSGGGRRLMKRYIITRQAQVSSQSHENKMKPRPASSHRRWRKSLKKHLTNETNDWYFIMDVRIDILWPLFLRAQWHANCHGSQSFLYVNRPTNFSCHETSELSTYGHVHFTKIFPNKITTVVWQKKLVVLFHQKLCIIMIMLLF